MLYVSDVESTQTLLTPKGAQILLLFFIARFSMKKFLETKLRALYYAYCKETALLLICHIGWIFGDIFGRIKSNQEQQVIYCSFLFFYWLSNEIDDFVKYSENWHFSHFLIDGPQCSKNWAASIRPILPKNLARTILRFLQVRVIQNACLFCVL